MNETTAISKETLLRDESNREKENNAPPRNSTDASCSDDNMETDDSTISNGSGSTDSLALSSSSSTSDGGASFIPITTPATRPERHDRERGVSSLIDSAKRLQYNNEDESNYSETNEEELEGEDIVDDDTECSGGTVIASDFPEPPVGASEEEMNRYYWMVCYGENAKEIMESLEKERKEGLRSAPAKSCLSTKKIKNPSEGSSMTPRRLHPSPPAPTEMNDDAKLSTPNDDEDPTNDSTVASSRTKSQSAVKFGTNNAVEFDKLKPITEMTPMPTEIVQEIFPSESKEEPVEEQQVSRETAQNVAMLAEWDDLFDEDDDLEMSSTPKRKKGRKRTPCKSRSRRPSKSRRDSALFSAERKNLLQESDDDEHMLPMSVTIDPMEYTSPSTIAASERDSLEIDMNVTTTDVQVNRNSLESACVSPNSLASQRWSRETPKSARTSSSNILWAVHASGAELPSELSPHAISGKGLRPNQLNYSPGSLDRSSDSSPANSNQSLASDIMTLFTQHTIDSESELDLQQHLAILSNHPLQMLHLRVGDMEKLSTVLDKDPLKFLNEGVLHDLTPSTALALVKGKDENNNLFSHLLKSTFSTNNVDIIRSLWCLESLLQQEVVTACCDQSLLACFGKSQAVAVIDDDEIISSCVKTCHDTASHEWANIELCIMENTLNKLQDLAEMIDRGKTKQVAAAPCRLSKPIQDEMSKIKALEEELAQKSNHLASLKRAQEVLSCSLELEHNYPIVSFSEDIRSIISPGLEPFTQGFSGSDFSFTLLDGSAEVTMVIDSDEVKMMGFSVKDECSSTKLLQAIFLGTVDTGNEIPYPMPIRSCVMSSQLLLDEPLNDKFMAFSCLFSRIDSLLKSVKSLETDFLCSVDSKANDTILSFSASQDGDVVKVDFVFDSLLTDTWNITTIPTFVEVSILSDEDTDDLCAIMQHKINAMLGSANLYDPWFLVQILHITMAGISEANKNNAYLRDSSTVGVINDRAVASTGNN